MQAPELLLPAGGFEAGIAAFEGGADAVYLGLSEFSARRQARNFDRLEYRRLLEFARSQGKRIYVALNTVLLEGEIGRAAELLALLALFPPDAAIIQDWGLGALLRERFPGIPIHASTQTAIQTPAAAQLAASLGVSRIILPRETTALELAEFRDAVPGVEFEVFVHGALCYSYSGLCLASGMILGRSGNRGECAQLCRSYYDALGPGLRGRGYWFSCRDLALADRIGDYARAGATSFKVEGRMKSPEYVFAAARFYRTVLDELTEKKKPILHGQTEEEALRISFSRASTPAYAGHHAGADMIDPAFPGHRGLPAGRCISRLSPPRDTVADFLLEIDRPLGLRDGLLFLLPQEEGLPPQPVYCSVLELREESSGKKLLRAEKGRVVARLGIKSEASRLLPVPGTLFSRISAREQDRKKTSQESYHPRIVELVAEVSLDAADPPPAPAEAPVYQRLILQLDLPRFDGSLLPGNRLTITDEEALPLAPGKTKDGFLRAMSVLTENGTREYQLSPILVRGEAPSLFGLPFQELFAPPSALKQWRKRLYDQLDQALAAAQKNAADTAARFELTSGVPQLPAGLEPLAVPPRAALCFPEKELPTGMPFATPRLLRAGAELPHWGGRLWLPLMPLVARYEAYEQLVLERVQETLATGASLVIGIDGLHHIALAQKLVMQAERLGTVSRLAFFGDIHLYASNRLAIATFRKLLPSLVFCYEYIEADADTLAANRSHLPESLQSFLAPLGAGFEPPLFLSKACLLRHLGTKGSCPSPCPRKWSFRLRDRDRTYLAVTEECITMLFRLSQQAKLQF